MHAIALALAALLIVAACAAVGGPESPGTSPTPSQSPSPSPSPLVHGAVPAELFEAIVDDAASRAGIDRAALALVQAAAVTWSDGSLGCPKPAMSYTQALVPGYRVVLEAAGTQYDYHADQRGNFSLCPPGRAKDPVGGDAL